MFLILYPVGIHLLVLSFCTWSQFVTKFQSQFYSWYNTMFFIPTSIATMKWFWLLYTNCLLLIQMVLFYSSRQYVSKFDALPTEHTLVYIILFTYLVCVVCVCVCLLSCNYLDPACSTRSSQAAWIPWQSVTLPTETFQTGKLLVILSLAKLRQNADAILKSSVSFVCADISHIISSFCKNVLKIVTPQSRL